MKYLSFVLSLIFLDVVGCVGCWSRHEDPKDPDYLDVSTTTVDLKEQQGSENVIALRSNLKWAIITNNGSWLEIVPMSGEGDAVITVTAKASNESTTGRYCTMTVRGGDIIQHITVFQKGKTFIRKN